VRVLAEAGAVSRAELARRAALAPSTVSSVVGELADAGLVVERAVAPAPARSAMGRPPVLVTLHRDAGVALGIDFGKRHLRVVIADLAHTVLAERTRELDPDMPAAEGIPLSAHLVDEVLDEAEASRDEIVGVGMGLPGPVHEPSGELGDSTILPGWVGVRAADAMRAALGLEVDVGNDGNLGALSEWMWGAGQGADDMVYLKVATGIGAGLIVGGRPYAGAGGTAGEIGHTVIDPGGAICRCGNRGCLETVAGALGVLAALRETHGQTLTVGEAIAKAVAGDAGCRRAIADAGTAIGLAVATLCNLVNPRRIVVGGELAAAGELLLDPMRESLRRGAIRSAADDVIVVEGALGDRAEVLGAVALVLRRGVVAIGATNSKGSRQSRRQ
jgi:predicted NBD/HSP70 family sugar kinase